MKRQAIALGVALALSLTFTNARADTEAEKKAETAEAIALQLLMTQSLAAANALRPLQEKRAYTATYVAAMSQLDADDPMQSVALWWSLVQNLDQAGLIAFASERYAHAIAVEAAVPSNNHAGAVVAGEKLMSLLQ